MGTGDVLLVLDLVGVFAFALNGALTAMRSVRLDVVGVVGLGMTTALGGGIVRDVLLGDLPPATFGDWRYLGVAAGSALVAFVVAARLDRLTMPINLLDGAGLSLFAVTGAGKAVEMGLGPVQSVVLGTLTAVGGGTLRDVLMRQVPSVLNSELYAVPAMVGAAVVTVGAQVDAGGWLAVVAAAICFAIRLVAIGFDVHAPSRGGTATP